MTENNYTNRMLKHKERIDKIWYKMAEDTNKFISDNPDRKMKLGTYSEMNNPLEQIGDSLVLKGAWIYDRLARRVPSDRGSITKKVRRALGYTYP